jgi:phospholipid transport system transporter-binding protein
LETIDCAALSDFDSSALAVLIAWQKKLRQSQRNLVLVSPPPKLCVLAQVYGVAELLGTPAT